MSKAKDSNITKINKSDAYWARKKNFSFDYMLLFIIIFILAFGLVMLYSTSAYGATVENGDSLYYLKKQCFAAVLGFSAMFIVSKIDYNFWKKFLFLAYVGTFGLCLAVIFVGTTKNNSSRWLDIGGVSVQPSEIAKVVIILCMASIIADNSRFIARDWRVCLLALAVAVPFFAVVGTNNLSTAVIIIGIAFCMTFIAYPGYKMFAILMALGAGVLVLYIQMVGYRASRIAAWLDPEAYVSGKGFQTLQGLYAIGNGGLFGKGLGEGLQKYIVPEARNDMIFSIICEELGLFGAVCVIMMYILLIYRLYYIADHARDLMGTYICVGIMVHIALQVIMNIAVVTNTMPNTGVILPLISYGGTSTAVLLAEFGLALNVSKTIVVEGTDKDVKK